MRDQFIFCSEVNIVFYLAGCRMLRVFAFLCGAMLSAYLSKLAQTKQSKIDLMHI